MTVRTNNLGLEEVHGPHGAMLTQSADVDPLNSDATPGASYLWLGAAKLDRTDVSELAVRLTYWLTDGSLKMASERSGE